MIDQAYNQVVTELTRDYEFVIRGDGLGIQLKIKPIYAILWRTGLTGVY